MFLVGFCVFKFYYISKVSSNLLSNSTKENQNVQSFISNIHSFVPWHDIAMQLEESHIFLLVLPEVADPNCTFKCHGS